MSRSNRAIITCTHQALMPREAHLNSAHNRRTFDVNQESMGVRRVPRSWKWALRRPLTGTFGSIRKEVFALPCLADTPREFGGSHPEMTKHETQDL